MNEALGVFESVLLLKRGEILELLIDLKEGGKKYIFRFKKLVWKLNER